MLFIDVKANNTYMEHLNGNKESLYIQSWDIRILYGWKKSYFKKVTCK